ncbi:MAG: four helix bundle protein [Bacteroidales bacterium]|nr:four helix bundle protein [Bacteroidales bacterium]
MEERTTSFFRFEDLRVYTKSQDYLAWLGNTVNYADSDPQDWLLRKWNDAAWGISISIVEGSARGRSQFEHLLRCSKTHIRECVVCTQIALRRNYITPEVADQSRSYLMELTRMTGSLLVSLQRNDNRSENADTYMDNNFYDTHSTPSDKA